MQLGFSTEYRSQIVTAVTTDTASSQANAISKHSTATIRKFINEVVDAANSALTLGLAIALTVSGLLLLVSVPVAFTTETGDRLAMGQSDGSDIGEPV